MKIVIVGPGAMGLLFYGLCSRSKEDVWLLDRDPRRATALKKNGVKLEGLTTLKVGAPQVIADPRQAADADVWIICVKSYDTKSLIKSIQPFVRREAVVVSLQNGLGNVELLAEAFGPSRVIAGVTGMAATLLEEGVCRHTGEGETVLGRLDGNLTVELKQLREFFLKSKVTVKISKDVAGLIWSKLIMNVGINALGAIMRLKNGRLMSYEGSRRLMKEAIQEAYKVAKRKRIKLAYDDPWARAESVCEATADNEGSMLADIRRRKKTEIDYLNGAIVRHGESLGIKTPVNALLCDIVKTLEASYEDRIPCAAS